MLVWNIVVIIVLLAVAMEVTHIVIDAYRDYIRIKRRYK